MESVGEDEATLRILDAAHLVLSNGDAGRVTMNQIADAAGLGVATVYRRFPRKAQLFRALLIRETERVTAVVGAAMEGESTVEMQAASGFGAFAQSLNDHPYMVRMLRGEGGGANIAPGEISDQVMAIARTYIADWLRVLQAEGRYTSVDADIVGEIEARLALSFVLAPEGKIPMRDPQGIRAFAAQYLVALLGPEH